MDWPEAIAKVFEHLMVVGVLFAIAWALRGLAGQ